MRLNQIVHHHPSSSSSSSSSSYLSKPSAANHRRPLPFGSTFVAELCSQSSAKVSDYVFPPAVVEAPWGALEGGRGASKGRKRGNAKVPHTPMGSHWFWPRRALLEGVCGRLEAIFGRLGSILGHHGGTLSHLGLSWGHLGPSWAGDRWRATLTRLSAWPARWAAGRREAFGRANTVKGLARRAPL